MKKLLILSLLAVFCQGCASSVMQELRRPENIYTKLAGLYSDGDRLYVHYTADLPFKTYERIGIIDKSSLWDCAQAPSRRSELPHTVEHDNNIYHIFAYDPGTTSLAGGCCKKYSIVEKDEVNFSSLLPIPVVETAAIDKDDPAFDDTARSLYAFNVNSDEGDEKLYLLLVDRDAKRVLVMQGLNMPELYVEYHSVTGAIVGTVGAIPAAAFDVVTAPLQIALFCILWNNAK